ncbi:MAG: flagellar biosynthetic protein FliO [Calditrichaeota bacterium]|nr:flagellar biosynthetic protein FliO [Calditrichota bacterium]
MSVDILKTFAALAIVLGLIFLLAWAYKKFLPAGQIGVKDQEGWRLLGTRVLSHGKQVFVLEVGKKLLLIGATDKTMSALMEVHDEADRIAITNALANKPTTSFAELLRRSKPNA